MRRRVRLSGMRHRGAALSLAAGTLTLVAGCGNQSPAQTGAPHEPLETMVTATSPGGGPAVGGPKPPAGAEPVAGSRVNASELPAGFPREVWTTGAGGALGLYGEQGGCQTISASVVEQNDTQVTVRLLQIQPKPTEHQAGCPMYERERPLSVTLAQPLGNRTVLLQLSIQEG
jgi:hypothetical protein